MTSQSYYNQNSRTNNEIVVNHYKLNDNVVAVAVSGYTFNYKNYLNGEELHTTSDKSTLQCPLLFRYTSTERNMIQTIHKKAMNIAVNLKIPLYEDAYPGPWRTNGKAYVYWAVGPMEVQQKGSGKLR